MTQPADQPEAIADQEQSLCSDVAFLKGVLFAMAIIENHSKSVISQRTGKSIHTDSKEMWREGHLSACRCITSTLEVKAKRIRRGELLPQFRGEVDGCCGACVHWNDGNIMGRCNLHHRTRNWHDDPCGDLQEGAKPENWRA